MIELDGVTYQAQSPNDCALEIVQNINDFCTTNNVRNRKGDIVHVEVTNSSVLWLMIYGIGYMISKLQRVIYSIGAGLNLSACSDNQLLPLAEIAGMKRKEAQPTTLTVRVTASSSGPLAIVAGLTMTLADINGVPIIFKSLYDITIPANATQTIILSSEKLGPSYVPLGTVAFDLPPTNWAAGVSYSTTPGTEAESYNSLRQRMQARARARNEFTRAAEIIAELPGVSSANIFFNYSALNPVVVMGKTVQPRQALLLVDGMNAKIAETYCSALSTFLTGETDSSAVQQQYALSTGTVIKVPIYPPQNYTLYVKVLIREQVTEETTLTVQDTIIKLDGVKGIGENLSASEVVLHMDRYALRDVTVVDAQLSENGTQWAATTLLQVYQRIRMQTDRISIERLI